MPPALLTASHLAHCIALHDVWEALEVFHKNLLIYTKPSFGSCLATAQHKQKFHYSPQLTVRRVELEEVKKKCMAYPNSFRTNKSCASPSVAFQHTQQVQCLESNHSTSQ